MQYDTEISVQTNTEDDIPVKVVNDFLIKEGYMPKVLKTYTVWEQIVEVNYLQMVEVLHLGVDTDPSPLFDELEMLPGVTQVGFRIFQGDPGTPLIE